MRVLVTGGSGYVGSWLARTLVARGDHVVSFDWLPFPTRDVAVEEVRGDIRDAEALTRACQHVDVIVHTAARVPLTKDHRGFHTINVGGTRTVLEVAERLRIRKVIHISSSAIFGVPRDAPVTSLTPRRPVDPYGRSKSQAEAVCEAFRARGVHVVMLRPRTIVGPERLGIFHILFDWIAAHKRIYLLGPGTNRLQLLSIHDLCAACLLAIDRADAVTLGIGGRAFGTLREDLGALIAHAGSRSRIVSLPAGPAIAALRVLDWLHLSPLAAWHYLTYNANFWYDDAAARTISYQPRDGNIEILTQSYDWYLAQGRHAIADASSPHRTAPRQRFLKLLRWFS